MALDWSAMQLPGLMIAGEAKKLGEELGQNVLGPGLAHVATRENVMAKDISEAYQGQGRSYYKDRVNKTVYPEYEDWLESGQAGDILVRAEAGHPLRRAPSGEIQTFNMSSDSWDDIGQRDAEGFWNPYGDRENLTPFEKHAKDWYMDPVIAGTEEAPTSMRYGYKAPKSLLQALFSPETFRPSATPYREAAHKGYIEDKTPQQIGVSEYYSGLPTKWNPGKNWQPGKLAGYIKDLIIKD